MAETSTIEWTDATWNPITGCSVLSPGCTHCYAMKLAGTRLAQHPSRAGLTRDSKAGPVWTGAVRLNEQWLAEPLRWRRPRMIFVCAHGDLFHEKVPDEWIDQVFAVMALAPQHTFQVLTKRAERMRAYMTNPATVRRIYDDVVDLVVERKLPFLLVAPGTEPPPHLKFPRLPLGRWPLPNAWLGVSAEDQQRADERIPALLATPAAVRWLSAEPLLGTVDLRVGLRNAWKVKHPHRGWDSFCWPDWVPPKVRAEVEDFWRLEWGRGPTAWLSGAIYNGQPPLGARASFRAISRGEPLVTGRFVPAWNNLGRVVDEQDTTHIVSTGGWPKHHPQIDWVVAGGESGAGARPMHPDWARSLRDQCAATGTAFFFKQWGEWHPCEIHEEGGPCYAMPGHAPFDSWKAPIYSQDRGPGWNWRRLGKKAAGRLLDGVQHDAMPEVGR